MNRVVLIILAASIVGLCALVFIATRPSEVTQRWIAYNPALLRGSWAKEQFARLDSPDFDRALVNAMTRSVKNTPALQARVSKLVDLERSFLKAYSSDSFEQFWAFRVPTKKYRENQIPSDISLPLFFSESQQILQATNIAFTPNPDDLASRSIRQQLEFAWERCKPYLEYATHNKADCFKPCTGCFVGACLDTIDITSYSSGSPPPDLLNILKNLPNVGVHVSRGLLEIQPSLAELTRAQPGAVDFVTIRMTIQIKYGFAHPIYLAAYWNPSDEIFVPLSLGFPDSSVHRAMLFF